jgi:hypothetical protein
MKRDLVRIMLLTLFVSAFSLFLSIRAAQSESGAEPDETGLKIAGFQWGGAIELGYRWTDIDGSRDRYKTTVNLMQGFRLFELSLWGRNLDEKKGLVDYFSVDTTGIGDPFPYGRLEIKKNKVYDFVATYREYKYFSEVEATGNLVTGFPFNFNQRSTVGTVGLSVFPKDDVKLNFGYRYYARDGDALIPSVFLLPDQKQNLDERLNEYFISADFPIANWDFHVKQTYWNFENNNKMEGPQQFENPDSHWNTYVSTIKAHTKFGERWDLDTGYIFAHSEGRADLLTSPNPFVSSGDSKTSSNINVFELGLSYALIPTSLIAHLDYQFHSVDQNGRANTDPFLGAPVNANTDYNLLAYTGTLQLEYILKENLTLRGGVRFQYRDINGDNFVVNRFDGGKHPNNTDIFAIGWVASASWKPFKFLSLYGEYQGANFDNPYTWISPENQNIAKAKIRYDTPIEKLSLIGTFSWRRGVNPDQEYRVDVQDYTITATYQPSFLPKLLLDYSFTYEKVQNSQNITNELPTPPYTRFSFDSDALIYTAGISYEGIYKGLGAKVNGSYAKTTKENPERYADFVVSFWYKNKYFTPIFTFEKTYLHDQLVRASSFNAYLYTLSLRKEF